VKTVFGPSKPRLIDRPSGKVLKWRMQPARTTKIMPAPAPGANTRCPGAKSSVREPGICGRLPAGRAPRGRERFLPGGWPLDEAAPRSPSRHPETVVAGVPADGVEAAILVGLLRNDVAGIVPPQTALDSPALIRV
jgi:hypothetical protein